MKLSACRIESVIRRSICVSVTLKLSVRELSLMVMRTVMSINCKLRAGQSPSVRARTGNFLLVLSGILDGWERVLWTA